MNLQLPAVLDANADHQRAVCPTASRSSQPSRHLAILTCMDARLDLFRPLGLEVGDAHILRNAGGRASPDAIRSLVVSTHLLATREIGVIHHTNCGLEGRTNDDMAHRTGVQDVDFLTFDEVEGSVRDDVEIIRGCGLLPDGVTVWGAVYDVDAGAIRVIVTP